MVELPGGDAYFFDIRRCGTMPRVQWRGISPRPMGGGTGTRSSCTRWTARTRGSSASPLHPGHAAGAGPRTFCGCFRPWRRCGPCPPSGPHWMAWASGEMWRSGGRLGSYGMGRESIGVEMTMRLVMPFAFLILSILCTAMGWSLRVRQEEGFPAAGIVLMPLLPVALAIMSLLYLHAHRIIVGLHRDRVRPYGGIHRDGGPAAHSPGLSLVLLAGQSSR